MPQVTVPRTSIACTAGAGPALRAREETVRQDWRRIAAYLSHARMTLEIDPEPRQFAGGLANLNYLVRIDDGNAVLRRPPMGPLPPGAYDMGRESRILSRLHEQFPLAPRALHLCLDTEVIGAPFQITEYRRGFSVRESVPPPWVGDAEVGQRLTTMLIEVLTSLHRVDPSTVGLSDLGRPDGFLGRAVEGWIKRAHLALQHWALPTSFRLLIELGDWLRSHAVPDRRIGLLHNDFKLDNVLLDAQSLAPVAVLDWDQGTRGDVLFDLATLLSYWTEPRDPPLVRAIRQMPTEQPGFPRREAVAQAYAAASGADLSDFRFHRVLAQLKTAVIILQLHLRYRTGETREPRYAEFAGIGQALLEQAHDIATNRIF
jgi:aminoglycoside phosphotransferase (APT) family kinase protein